VRRGPARTRRMISTLFLHGPGVPLPTEGNFSLTLSTSVPRNGGNIDWFHHALPPQTNGRYQFTNIRSGVVTSFSGSIVGGLRRDNGETLTFASCVDLRFRR